MRQKRLISVSLAVAAFAFGAIATMASAADLDPETGGFPLTFSGVIGEPKFTSGLGTTTATAVDVHGEFETAIAGWIEFTFTNLTEFGGTCTSTVPVAPEGLVTTTKLPFRIVMIDSTSQLSGGKPGMLITGNSEHMTTFKCPMGTIEWKGNGVIGEIRSPSCASGTFTKTATIEFASAGTGNQQYKQVETTGTTYDLIAKSLLGTLTTSWDFGGAVEFVRKVKLTCP